MKCVVSIWALPGRGGDVKACQDGLEHFFPRLRGACQDGLGHFFLTEGESKAIWAMLKL